MTNKERQGWLDKRKWLDSELVKHDMSGEYIHCDYCCKLMSVQKQWVCTASQEEREDGCLCAKAYNRYYKKRD